MVRNCYDLEEKYNVSTKNHIHASARRSHEFIPVQPAAKIHSEHQYKRNQTPYRTLVYHAARSELDPQDADIQF